MLRGTVSDGILVDFLGCHSAKEMWDYALETNSLEDPETQAEIWNEFARSRLEEEPTSQQMDDHMELYNGLLLKATYAGLNLRETERIDRFLVTLPKSFEVFRLQFRATSQADRTWMTVRREYNREQNSRASRARIEQEDRQMATVLAMKSRKTPRDPSTIKCYKCEKMGHIIRDCPNPPSNNYRPRNNEKSSSGKALATSGETETPWALSMAARPMSRKTWMWNEGYGISSDDDVESVVHETAYHTVDDADAIYNATDTSSRRWILDSGATHHITPHCDQLVNVRPLPAKMTFAIVSGGHLSCSKIGDLPVRLKSGREAFLTDVHVVPESDVNLLSARVLACNGWSVSLRSDTAIYQQRNGGSRTTRGPRTVDESLRKGGWRRVRCRRSNGWSRYPARRARTVGTHGWEKVVEACAPRENAHQPCRGAIGSLPTHFVCHMPKDEDRLPRSLVTDCGGLLGIVMRSTRGMKPYVPRSVNLTGGIHPHYPFAYAVRLSHDLSRHGPRLVEPCLQPSLTWDMYKARCTKLRNGIDAVVSAGVLRPSALAFLSRAWHKDDSCILGSEVPHAVVHRGVVQHRSDHLLNGSNESLAGAI